MAALIACGEPTSDGLAEVEPGEALPGGDTTNQLLLGSNAFIKPAANLSDEHESMFFTGNSFFNQNWIQAPASTQTRDGLGPLFNARSCSACHFKDGRGRPALSEGEPHRGFLARLSVPGQNNEGGPVGDPNYGGQLQDNALPDVPSEGHVEITYEEVPGVYGDGTPYTLLRPSYALTDLAYGSLSEDILFSPRVAPAVIGLGLLEAIPEATLEAMADPDDANKDGISGRINRVWDVEANDLRPGRFGWKAEQPTVLQQSAGAFLGDIGITSRLFKLNNCTDAQADCLAVEPGGEPELEDHLLERVTIYTAALAVPKRRGHDKEEVLRGKFLFAQAGCTGCHTPKYTTGEHPYLPAMSNQLIWPYTDLLLHDMGEALSDDRPVYDAQGSEWRTPPLWGVGLIETVNRHNRLLHDGRARGVAEAILWHGGEAQAAREAFRLMPLDDREALIRFVKSL